MEQLAIASIVVIVLVIAALAYFQQYAPFAGNSKGNLNSLGRTVSSLEKRTAALLREREAICTTIRDLQSRLAVLEEELQCDQ